MSYSCCSFTGHRHIKAEHRPHIAELVKRGIEYAYGEGCRVFCSGGALGFDTLAAREVIRFRITHPDVKLILFLPCIDQASMWNSDQRDSYEYLIRTSDEIRYAADSYTDSCMRERNFMLADACDLLIAYSGRSRSGSSQTVGMAERLGKTVYNLYPTLDRLASE